MLTSHVYDPKCCATEEARPVCITVPHCVHLLCAAFSVLDGLDKVCNENNTDDAHMNLLFVEKSCKVYARVGMPGQRGVSLVCCFVADLFLNSSHAKLCTSDGTDPLLLPKESTNAAIVHL